MKISFRVADMEAGSEDGPGGGTPKRDGPEAAKDQQSDPKTDPEPKSAVEVGGGCRAKLNQTCSLQPNKLQGTISK